MTRKLIAIVLSLILMISVTFSVAETTHELVDLGAESLQNEEYDATIQYFLQAAELGEAVAYYDLGAVYLNGYGVEPSNETAILASFDDGNHMKEDEAYQTFTLRFWKTRAGQGPEEDTEYNEPVLKLIVIMLIRNFRKEDESLIFQHLEGLPITYDNEDIWHEIVFAILDSINTIDFPSSFLYWAYEASLCSQCRESIVDELIKRKELPESYKEEMKWDANLDIRALATN